MFGRARSRTPRKLFGRDAGGRRARTLLPGMVLALVLGVALTAAMGAFASGGPTVETERATEVTRTEAVLNAAVDPQGNETSCEFEYGTSPGSFPEKVPCLFSPGHRSIKVPENANLTGLTPSTTYYFRIHAHNSGGDAFGEEKSFTALPAKPHANTESAREVKRTSATLTGFVTPNGAEVTNCHFAWGSEAGKLTETANCEETVGTGSEPSEPVFVKAHITGLTEGHAYYYRLLATNEKGTDQGGQVHFVALPSEPKANTEPATAIGRTTATLRGFVTPNDAKITNCTFHYGLEGSINKEAPCNPVPTGEGEVEEAVSAEIGSLSEGTKYSFYLAATNAKGTGEGGVANFCTQPCAPKVEMHHARNITATSAELAASVDPNLQPTECYFEYGTTPALGGVAPCTTSPGEGEDFVKVTATVMGLTPDTEYLVRVVAFNAGGSARGGEGNKHNFTTAKGGEQPVVTSIKPSKGLSSGKTAVVIKGAHLEEANAVYFGFEEATIKKVEGAEKIEVESPPGVGVVDITVSTPNGTSKPVSADKFTYGKPTISGLSPNHGSVKGGTPVTVSGSGFELGKHGTTFHFGKEEATSVECTTSTECTVVAPASHKEKVKAVTVQANVNGKKSPGNSANARYQYEP